MITTMPLSTRREARRRTCAQGPRRYVVTLAHRGTGAVIQRAVVAHDAAEARGRIYAGLARDTAAPRRVWRVTGIREGG